jgi:hypothetical protein
VDWICSPRLLLDRLPRAVRRILAKDDTMSETPSFTITLEQHPARHPGEREGGGRGRPHGA